MDSICHAAGVEYPLLVRQEGAIKIISLNRPEKKNALTLAMLEALTGQVKDAAHDHSIKAVILCGTGGNFSSGFDLIEGQDLEVSLKHGDLLVKAQIAIAEAPKPFIAAVSGFALAGGGALIGACDYVSASKEAQFGYPVLKVGIVPTPGMPFLRQQMSERHFRELVLGGELKSAAWAAQVGLINAVLDTPEDAFAEARRFASLVSDGNAEALRITKRFCNTLLRGRLRAELDQALSEYKAIRKGPGAIEGLKAFAEKRKPNWD